MQAIPERVGVEGAPETPLEVAASDIMVVDVTPPEAFKTSKSRDLKDRSMKARIADWIRFRALEPGITNKEVARRLGISPSTLNNMIYRANKQGWLKFEDPLQKLEYEIIPKAVDNLNHFLDAKDRTVTIEVAKGTIFRQFQDTKGIQDAPTTVLALKIEHTTPEGIPEVQVMATKILGRPKALSEEGSR